LTSRRKKKSKSTNISENVLGPGDEGSKRGGGLLLATYFPAAVGKREQDLENVGEE